MIAARSTPQFMVMAFKKPYQLSLFFFIIIMMVLILFLTASKINACVCIVHKPAFVIHFYIFLANIISPFIILLYINCEIFWYRNRKDEQDGNTLGCYCVISIPM